MTVQHWTYFCVRERLNLLGNLLLCEPWLEPGLGLLLWNLSRVHKTWLSQACFHAGLWVQDKWHKDIGTIYISRWQRKMKTKKKSTNWWQILSFGGVSRSGQHSLTRWFCGVTWLQFHHWASPRSCLAPKSGSLAFSKSLWTAPFLAN